MEFREYKKEDADEIIKWIRNEKELIFWSADVYNKFPLEAEDINDFYENSKRKSSFYPISLVENDKLIGHLILRNPDDKYEVVRLGFVIVDPSLRGKGLGKAILRFAVQFSKEVLSAKEINLGVFQENESAYYCYKSVGFVEDDTKENETFKFKDEDLNCIELIYKGKKIYT